MNADPRPAFREFVYYEKAVGGPDPHMAIVQHLSRGVPQDEMLRRIGCYAATYNSPGAQFLWQAAPRDGLEDWLGQVWPVPTRRERRVMRRPEWMARFLMEYTAWSATLPDKAWFTEPRMKDRYEAAWADITTVWSMGRYIAIKALELMNRTVLPGLLPAPDIRAKGGWSPRQGLALLFPAYSEAFLGGDDPSTVSVVEQYARAASVVSGAELSMFETQVFLCDFKQSWVGKRQYPGRSIDSELEYWYGLAARGMSFDSLLEARRELFPEVSLGELNGWGGVRKELGHFIHETGETWSDLKYDYRAGKVPR